MTPSKTTKIRQTARRPRREESEAPGKRRPAATAKAAGKPAPRGRADGTTRPGALGKAEPTRSSVRIIAGAWRGRRIEFAEMPGLRPTPDRVRETVFNWLQHSVVDSRCLDLFAGSGALGLEALSRGAQSVIFVEQAQRTARGLVAELARLGGTPRGRVVEMGASRFLRSQAATYGAPFDIVFMDPPYGQGAIAEYVPWLDAGQWLKTGGLVYLESEKKAGAPALPPHWELLKSKSAGEVGYHLVRVNAQLATA